MDHLPPVPSTPTLPRQTHTHSQQARRKNIPSPSRATLTSRDPPSAHASVAPASTEVISSLITSLAVISKPATASSTSPFDAPFGTYSSPLPGSVSLSPTTSGSFGVDYGAFIPPEATAHEDDTNLDELAAAPPVIRTAKPPSGFSPLTAPKSPTRDPSAGTIKSLLGGRSSSRPSSKGSLASRDADTQSIGNVSIERGAVSPVAELHRRSSHDSWGKKTSRSHRGLMYMSSKERLREKEAEKRRGSIGSTIVDRLSASGGPVSPRTDPFLAETPIREESHPDSPDSKGLAPHLVDNSDSGVPSPRHSPRPIPARESSLHKTGPNAKRSSRRISKSKTDPAAINDTIQEIDEHQASKPSKEKPATDVPRDTSALDSPQRHPSVKATVTVAEQPNAEPAMAVGQRPNVEPSMAVGQRQQRSFSLTNSSVPRPLQVHTGDIPVDYDLEDGAPFPAVAQGRRRDRSLDGRRRSSQQTPDPPDGLKRSGSKLKRLSSPRTPRFDDKHSLGVPDGGSRSRRPSIEETQVVYERPASADSIDDSVEAYLCSPRLSQKIRHPQTGRIISFSEVGDSEGSAVFCCVGMGLTRYIMAFYDELALTLKLRLITPDRPGVGDSEPYADGTATPLSWPDDVYAICQALKITKFSILAHSAGAIYALATALRMPQHIRGRIHLLAPWIPPSQMSVFGSSAQTPLPPTNAIPTSQRILRALPTPFLKAANSSFMSATSSSITSSLPKTPKRKRKSNAAPKDREKDPARQTPPPPAVDNKENMLAARRAAGSGEAAGRLSPLPSHRDKDLGPMADMDRIRPRAASPASPALAPGSGSDMRGSGGHQKTASASGSGGHGTIRDSREAGALAAAADALADRERQATYDSRLTHAIWELATTGANPAVDLLVCLERRHTIGFRYVDITRPVIIHHGSRDSRVPVENVRWLGKTMRRCEVRVLEGEGHGLMASAVVMGGVLMEIAKEWEDWGRLTGSTRARDSLRDERPRRGTIGMAR